MTAFQTESHVPHNRDNFFQFGNTAWDAHERRSKEPPQWPKTLKGMTAAEVKSLAKERTEFLLNMSPVWTPQMEAADSEIRKALTLRGNGSPQCFGLRGEPFVGKTQIIQRFVDEFHCEHTKGRPFENSASTGDDMPPVPVVWLPTDRTTKQIAQSFLLFYGQEVKTGWNEGTLMDKVRQQVRQHRTQIVVLDDVHNLRGKDPANDLKIMYEKLGQVMFLFTRTFDHAPAFDPKKGGTQTLERTVWQTVEAPKIDSDEWMELVSKFELAMPWCYSSESLVFPHMEFIYNRTKGKTGRLVDLFKALTYEMIQNNKGGEDVVTESMIRAVSMANDFDDLAA